MNNNDKKYDKIKRKNIKSFVCNFPTRIRTAERYLIRMQNIISSYGFSNDHRLSGINNLIDFFKNTEFHRLDSRLNTIFDIANDYKLDYRLNNNPRMLRFNLEIERLSDMYKKLRLQIDIVDKSFYRDFINNNSLSDFIDSDDSDDFDDNEPSNFELMRIENRK